MIKNFIFDHEPTFAELWEICVNNLLYNTSKYCDEIEKIFASHEISKKSRVLDVSAGSGFPAIPLAQRGYSIDCIDGFADETSCNKRAVEAGVSIWCHQMMWVELPKQLKQRTYDFLFCRGNSFIYAAGGWNQYHTINAETALKTYKKQLNIFFDLLQPGGYLYIDKFKDTEVNHTKTVATIQIKNKATENLLFKVEQFPKKHVRHAALVRQKIDGAETGLPNVTYLLSFKELEQILRDVGFKNVKKITISSEKNFDVLLVQK